MSRTSLKAQTLRKLRFSLCRHIVNVDRSSVEHGTTIHRSTADKKTLFAARPENWPIMRGPIQHVTINAEDNSIVCAANTGSVFGDDVQHRLDIRRRAGDHAENFTRRGLLLERFLE